MIFGQMNIYDYKLSYIFYLKNMFSKFVIFCCCYYIYNLLIKYVSFMTGKKTVSKFFFFVSE